MIVYTRSLKLLLDYLLQTLDGGHGMGAGGHDADDVIFNAGVISTLEAG